MPIPSQDYTYLLLGGVTKAGTTSVFEYLADHPQICGSSIKEPMFFLDLDLIPSGIAPSLLQAIETQDLTAYDNLFDCANRPIRLEASAGYFSSPNTPARIKRLLPNVKLVFILRNPVDRVISMYYYRQQNATLSDAVDLRAYINRTKQKPEGNHALNTGRYSQSLRRYYDHFPKEAILLLRYSDLQTNPKTLVTQICQHVGIDASMYEQYLFEKHNKTQQSRSQYLEQWLRRVKISTRDWLMRSPRLLKWTNQTYNQVIEPVYTRLNRQPLQKEQIPADVLSELEAWFAGEEEALTDLSGIPNLLAR